MEPLSYRIPKIYRFVQISGAIGLLVLLILSDGLASETTERRLKISLPLFPRIVAVDKAFYSKLTSENKARLVFVYQHDESLVNALVSEFIKNNKAIVDIEVEAYAITLHALLHSSAKVPTALFLAERLSGADLKELVRYSINNKILVFSPFSGDVERGVTAGLAITTRVFPYFNNKTLIESQIEINPLLLNMSKRYE